MKSNVWSNRWKAFVQKHIMLNILLFICFIFLMYIKMFNIPSHSFSVEIRLHERMWHPWRATFIENMPGKRSCIHKAAEKYFLFDNTSFFWNLKYFDTFVSFQVLSMVLRYGMNRWHKYKNSVEQLERKIYLTTSRNRQQQAASFLKKLTENLKARWMCPRWLSSINILKRGKSNIPEKEPEPWLST